MAFIIERITERGFPIIRLKDTNAVAKVDILPEQGSLLHAFEISLNGTPINVIDHYESRDDWEANLPFSYKSAKLSPFVCRIRDATYQWQGKTYSFSRKFTDGSAIHGLLYDKPFRITSVLADDNEASVRLNYHYLQDDPGYPWSYTCEICYRLSSGPLLQLETTVLNLSDDPLLLADGWHPYFRLGGTIDDYYLRFNAVQMLEFNEKLVPTGNLMEDTRFFEPCLIGNCQLDNCFPLLPSDGSPCCTLQNPFNGLTLHIFADSSYPYLQLFTPPHRQSIAIENLSGAPDCFNNGMGLQVLEPRRSVTFNAWYKIQTGKNS